MYSLVSYPLVVLIDSSQDPPCTTALVFEILRVADSLLGPAGQSCCVKVVGLPDGV
jgi:hypothetical protein